MTKKTRTLQEKAADALYLADLIAAMAETETDRVDIAKMVLLYFLPVNDPENFPDSLTAMKHRWPYHYQALISWIAKKRKEQNE